MSLGSLVLACGSDENDEAAAGGAEVESLSASAPLEADHPGKVRFPLYIHWSGDIEPDATIVVGSTTPGVECTHKKPLNHDYHAGECWVPPNTKLTLTPEIESGYRFVEWIGCQPEGQPEQYWFEPTVTYTVTKSTGVTCRLQITPDFYEVTAKALSGGTVSMTVPDPTHGFCKTPTSCTVTSVYRYPNDPSKPSDRGQIYPARVKLRAEPAPEFEFDRWNGYYTYRMDPLGKFCSDEYCKHAEFEQSIFNEDMTFEAVFKRKTSGVPSTPTPTTPPPTTPTPTTPSGGPYTVIAEPDANGGGMVALSSSDGFCFGNTCTINAGGSVTLEAIPNVFFLPTTFTGWSCDSRKDAKIELANVQGDLTCKATFAPQ